MLPPLLLVPALVAPVQARGGEAHLDQRAARPARPGLRPGGGAPGRHDAPALRQASDNARADVISRLRANVKADTRITTTYQESRTTGAAATGTRTQTTQVGTQVQAQAADLPGLVVEETFLDRPGASTPWPTWTWPSPSGSCGRAWTRCRPTWPRSAGEQGVRAKLVAAQALRKAHLELLKLDDLAALLSGGGGDLNLRADVLKARTGTETAHGGGPGRPHLRPGARAGRRTGSGHDGRGAFRGAQGGHGLVRPEPHVLHHRARPYRAQRRAGGAGAWWDYQRSPDFIVAQGSLSLGLVDVAGQQYESMTLVAKGVGVTEFQADTLLQADYRTKLAKAVSAWLADLGRW